MTAAALAARLGADWGAEAAGPGTGAALALVVAAGILEGAAVGAAQTAALGREVHGLRRGRWTVVTVLVAGLGWAAASAPAVLSAPGDAGEPPWPLVLAGAAALGAVMGAVLGAAQSVVLRPAVAHPWRWALVSTVAWTPAMAVIFLGATTAPAAWPLPAVVLLGTVTGVAAGAVLGLLCGLFSPVVSPPVAGAGGAAGPGVPVTPTGRRAPTARSPRR